MSGPPILPPAIPPAPAPTLEQRIERIRATRERLADTAATLRVEVETRLDWKKPIRRRPLAAVAVAGGAGFVLARLLRGRPRRAGAAAKGAPAAVGAGLGALIGSTLLAQLAPMVIERGVEFLIGVLERRLGGGGPEEGAGPAEPDPDEDEDEDGEGAG